MIKFNPARCALAAAVAVATFGSPLVASAAESKARVIVNYDQASSAKVRAAIAKLGGRVVVDLSEVNAVAVTLPAGKLRALKALRGVEGVEEDSIQTLQGGRQAFGAPLVLAAVAETVPYGIPMVQAQAGSLPALAAGTGKRVCIVDSGINATHEDLAANTMAGKNYVGVGDWNTDENSHGTHVAGTVAAIDNAVGVVGVAPNRELKLYISKVFDAAGSSASSLIAKGMLGCLQGKSNVLSMSLGGSSASSLQQKIATLLASRNVLMIAAAGNAGTSAVSYPAGFAEVVSVAAVDSSKVKASFSQFNADVEISGPGVGTLSTVPAGSQLGATASVGSTPFTVLGMDGSPIATANGALANFGFGDVPAAGSMTGKVCLISRGNISFADKVLNCQASGGVGAIIYNNTAGELAGTMGDVVTAIPSVGATQADGGVMLTKLGQAAQVSVAFNNDLYAAYSGTSMATPHVSAVAALVWSHFPTCTAAQIRAHLTGSAENLEAAGRDVNTGFGLVQARAMYDRIASFGCAGPAN
jgi:subtilisin family serine protease